MSSLAFRSAVAAAIAAKLPGVRYEPLENRDLPRNPPLNLPDVWITVGFLGTSRRQVTMGRRPWVEERGTCLFIVCSKAGHGQAAGVTQGTAIMHAFDGWSDTGSGSWFINVDPPEKIEDDRLGEWFLHGVPASYALQERITLD